LGTPLVSTDCESGPREILRDGKYGALVPVGDCDAMVFAMYEAITGKRSQPDTESWSRFTVPVATVAYLETLLPSFRGRVEQLNLATI
jgi:glycosyltransferase involved in cell wall biosynthesis